MKASFRMLIGSGTILIVAIGVLSSGAGAADSIAKRGPAGLVDPFRLIGKPGPENYVVTIDGDGRFVLRSRNRPLTPISPPVGCQVDNEQQVSCNAGLIKSMIVRLKRGRDKFVAEPVFRLPMFAVGGKGPDKLVAGNEDATLVGSTGGDRLVGARGKDSLYGRRGRDVLSPGQNINKAWGGSGFDVCIDKAGNNTFHRCEVIR